MYPRLYPRLYPYGPVPCLATKTLVYPSGNPIPWTYGLGIPLSPYPLSHPLLSARAPLCSPPPYWQKAPLLLPAPAAYTTQATAQTNHPEDQKIQVTDLTIHRADQVKHQNRLHGQWGKQWSGL